MTAEALSIQNFKDNRNKYKKIKVHSDLPLSDYLYQRLYFDRFLTTSLRY